MKEAFYLTQAVNGIILCRLMYQFTLGQIDQKALFEGAKLLLCLIGATLLASELASYTTQAVKYGPNLACQREAESLWTCAQWPFIWDSAGEAMSGLLGWLEPGLGVPAGAAGLIAQTYLFRRLAADLNFSAEELFTFFFWSTLVYLFLFRIDLLLTFVSAVVEQIGILSDRVAVGKVTLASWIRQAVPYLDQSLDNLSIFSLKFVSLAISISLVGAVINLGSFIVIIIQFLLLAFIPISFFKDVLSGDYDFKGAAGRLIGISMLGAFKNLNWAIISFLPTLDQPTKIDGNIILSTRDAWVIVGSSLTALAVSFVVYGLIILGCYQVYKRIF